MKKRSVLQGISLILMLVFTTGIYASQSMSQWAVEEVTESIQKELVPETLQMNYTTNIKRYEYVILANKVLDLTHRYVAIDVAYPFSDIYNHEYEEEMVKAYNAGIIEGDGRGLFRPDDEITRQEIASLVCNLMKAIDPSTDWSNTLNTQYSDIDLIAPWAMNYINYCYARDIIQGVGTDEKGLDKMDPLGKATIEQAIILMLRVANRYDLTAVYELGTIDIVTSIEDTSENVKRVGTEYYLVSDIINGFAAYTSLELAEYILEVSQLEEIDVLGMSENFVQIVDNKQGSLSYLQNEHRIELQLMTSIPKESMLKSILVDMVKQYTDSEPIKEALQMADYDSEESYDLTQEMAAGVNLKLNYSAELDMYQIKVIIDNEL